MEGRPRRNKTVSASFLNGAHEMRALCESLRDAVEAGIVVPALGDTAADIVLGDMEGADSPYLVLERQDEGVLRVHLRRRERGWIASWTADEVGTVVPALWESCRNRLYTGEVEEGLSGLSRWLRAQWKK